jgi:hypothetical protein
MFRSPKPTGVDKVSEEEQLVHAFFVPDRRSRYSEFLASRKHRRKFVAEMAHFKGLDERCKNSIPPAQQTAEGIAELLSLSGAPTNCLVISDHKEIDGVRLPLGEALDAVVGRTSGTFLSCRPGILAYFENEDGRWILKRN